MKKVLITALFALSFSVLFAQVEQSYGLTLEAAKRSW